MDTITVVLTEEEYAILCGFMQPEWMNVEPPHDKDAVNHGGIYASDEAWDSLRNKFPLAGFRKAVEEEIIEYDEEAGL